MNIRHLLLPSAKSLLAIAMRGLPRKGLPRGTSLVAAAVAAVVATQAGAQTVIPTSDEIVLPQYAVNGATTASRLPFVARLRLTNLAASATYRYYTGATTSATNTASGAIAGNWFGINTTSNAAGFVQGSSSAKTANSSLLGNNEFVTVNRYSEFTTDSSGNYTGWFSFVPTGNAAFVGGSDVYLYVQVNNGNGGTVIVQNFRTTSTIRMLDYGTVSNGTNQCSAAYGTSNTAAEQMVFIYDNTSGTGRPLYGMWAEDDGVAANFATWYSPNVEAQAGRYGLIIPNFVSKVARVEVRSTSTGQISRAANSTTGFAGTLLPSGGTTPVVLAGLPVTVVSTPNGSENLPVGSSASITWTTSSGAGFTSPTAVDVYWSTDGGTTYSLLQANVPNSGSYSWLVPNSIGSQNRIRITAAGSSSASDDSDANFAIVAGATACCNTTTGVCSVVQSGESCPSGGIAASPADTACGTSTCPSGACCQSSGCTTLTSTGCASAGGSYLGDGTVCIAQPTSPAANPPAICIGTLSTLSATAGPDEEIDWYAGSCGGVFLGTGSSINVQPLSTTTYFARARSTSTGCISGTCASVSVTVNPIPGAPTIAPVAPVCAGSPVTLTATVSGADTVDWFLGTCSGTPVASGLSVSITPPGTGNFTYFARGRNTTTSCTDGCSSVLVRVNPLPTAPSVGSGGTICAGSPFTLTGSAPSGSSLQWRTGSCTGAIVGTGNSLLVSPAATTTYYARSVDNTTGCLSSACGEVVINVVPVPSAPATSGNTNICAGASGTTLSATPGPNETVEWFEGSCGGTPIATTNSVTVNPATTKHYFARVSSTLASGCTSLCSEVVVTVIDRPTVSAGSSSTVTACSGGPYPLTGTVANAASVLWTTSGSGSFASATSASTSYTFSPADISAGTVTLTLTAQPNAPCVGAESSSLTITIQPRPSTSVVDASFANLPYGTVVTFPGQPGNFIVGCTAFGNIQSAIDSVSGSDVYVGPGTFTGDLTISSHVNLHGAGPGLSIISGAIGGPSATITYSGVSNCELDGFTITREGNNTTDWNNPGLNSAGIAFSGGSGSGCVVHNCLITGNRTGIDINNSSGATIRNCRITSNRTGLIMRNVTDNLTLTENEITDNWTVGILFLDASSGSNSPLQTALNCTIRDNTISGNWYGQICDRQSGGSLPAPGTSNLKNFSGNWFGSTSPVITAANSAEPGYAAQIPTVYGGTAVAPGGQPDICGPASANFDITPMLASGTDTDLSTYGFQGDFSSLVVTAQLAQTGSTGRVQEGNESLADGTLIGASRLETVSAGTYLEKPTLSKSATIVGANAGIDPCTGTRGAESVIMPDSGAATLAGTTTFVVIAADNITLDGLTIDGDNPALTSPFTANGANPDVDTGISAEAPNDADGLVVKNTIVKNIFQFGLALGATGEPARAGRIEHNRIDNVPYWAGIVVYDDYYAAINNNCINNAWRGVQTNNFYQSKPLGASATINNNTITTQTQAIAGDSTYSDVDGILVNLHYQNASDWTVAGNTIHNATANGVGSHGIQVWSIQTAAGVACSNNTITSFDDGYFVWNCPTTNTVTITGGSVSGNNNGLLLTNLQQSYGSAAATNLLVSGLFATSNAGQGMAVVDNIASTHNPVHLFVEGCTASGNAVGGVSTDGAQTRVTIRNAPSTLTGNAYGIYATKGGRVLVENADLRANGFGGIQIGGGSKIDAGDCLGTNFTGLGTGSGLNGSSHGGNNLVGYGFDNFSPQAITNQNPNSAGNQAYAQNNDFGAGTNDDIGALIFDHQDAAPFASVFASQSGGQGIATQPTSQSVCAGSTATFTVLARGATHFQWFFGASPIGPDSATLTIPNAGLGNAGSYHVQVSDDCGNAFTSNTVPLTVQPGPGALAGGPYSTCDVAPVAVNGSATDAASVLWTTSGSGTFVNATAASTSYIPSAADVSAGSVTLTFHALAIFPCTVEATATASLSLQPLPTASAGGPYTRCVGAGVLSLGGTATNTGQVTWSTSGTGSFGNIHAAATTYTPSPADEASGSVTLTLSAAAIAPCATAATSTTTITFQNAPTVAVGGPFFGCGGVAIPVSGTASGAASTLWTSSGTGTFADATALSTTYTPSPADVTAGSVTLTLTAQPVAPCALTSSATASMTISGTPAITYVDDNYASLANGTQVAFPFGGGGPLHTIGCDAFATIQSGINAVSAGGTVNVAAGNYAEDVAVNKSVHVLGAGAGASIVSGPIGGSINTFEIVGQPNVELAGFTITRAGNDISTWGGALNNNGVLASSSPNLSLHDNRFEGNRNALNMQFMTGATIRNNVITNNRTGLQCVDNVTNCTFTQNEISNNWTVGVLFRDETPAGSDTTGTTFVGNSISGNWYGQIVYRVGSSPFTLKNFSGNWLGTTSPVSTAANSAEPGYAAQIPVAFGGTAVAPGGQPDIAGDGSSNVDITPMLSSGVDTAATYGFQGDFSDLTVTSQLAQTGSTGRVQEGNQLLADGALTGAARIERVLAGTYIENPTLSNSGIISGANSGIDACTGARVAESIIIPAAGTATLAGTTTFVVVAAPNVTFDGLTIDGDNPALTSPFTANGANPDVDTGISAEAPNNADGLIVRNSIVTNIFQFGISMGSTGSASRAGRVEHNKIFNIPYWAGVLAYDDYYAAIENNCIEHVGVGVQTNNFYQPIPSGGSATINNNTVTLSTEVITGDNTYTNNYGLLINLHYANASPWQAVGNTIVNNSPRSAGSRGITVWSFQTDAALTLSGNTVTDLDTGIFLWNCPTTSTITVSGGTVSGANRGIVATNFDTYGDAGSSDYAISGVSVLDVRQSGISIIDSASNANSSTVYALITGNTSVHGGVGALSGVSISGTDASATILNNPASFTTNEVGVLVDGGAALIENSNLTGNSAAAIRVANNGRVDAGDCSGSDISGLGTGTGLGGSSAGLNNLSGYGFDSASPFAIDNLNGSGQSPVRAQNNNFGAALGDDIETVLSNNSNAALSHIYASQIGGPQILTDPVATTVCPGTTATFTVLAYGQNHYQWYFGAAPVGTDSATLSIPNVGPSNVGSYSVVVTDDCGNSPTSGTAALGLLPTPVAATSAAASDSNYCSAAAPATITLSAVGGSGTTFTWYNDTCGGTAIGTGLVLANVPGPTATTTYYGRWSTSCGDSGCVSVTVTVNQNPALPTIAASGSVCAGQSFNLSGTAGPGEVIDWYSTCGGTLLGTGTVSVSPTSDTTYFAKARNTTTGCSSVGCASILVSVIPTPVVDAGSDQTVCYNSVATLTGTATNAASILWTTSGTGSFADATNLSSTYTPSPADITAGSITLTLTAQPNSPCTTAASDTLTLTFVAAPSVVYVDDGYNLLPNGTAVAWPYPGTPGGPYIIGCNAFATVQGGINGVLPSGTVNVAAGTYSEDVSVTKSVHLLGAGAGASIISGPVGGSINTIEVIGQPNVEIAGFTITRDGNAVATWNGALNNNGLLSTSSTGLLVHDNRFEGNRNALNLQSVNNITIRNNVITNNRTGVQCVDAVTNSTFTQNEITGNWTLGILFRDEGGANAADTTGTVFSNNNISGNWYGQLVYRVGLSPFSTKNFSGNWLGTAAPVSTVANSSEPGYAAQIPVAFGGTAVPPVVAQPEIAGDGSANFDITPLLTTGVDTAPATYGFQGDFSDLTVTTQLAQTGTIGRIQEGHDLVTAGGTVRALAGAYSENVAITKRLTIEGAGAGDCDSAADPLTQTVVTAAAASTPVFDVVDVGGASPVSRLTLKDMRITGASGTGDGQSAGVRVSAASGQTRAFFRFENLTVTGNSGHGIGFSSAGTINDVEISSSNLCSNYRGVVIDDTLTGFNGLSISNSTIKNNTFSGLSVNGTPSGSFIPTNIAVSNSTFASNGQSNNFFQGSGDLSFFYFNGNASLTNVSVHTTGRVPVQFRGRGTDNFSTPWAPSGIIAINGLTVDGVADRSAIYMHYYADVNGVSLNNVDLSGVTSSAPAFSAFAVPGMTLVHLGATPLPLGNTIFPCQGGQAAGYVGLAIFGTGGAAADCTTTFVGASTLAQKESCVFDFDDLATVGDVTFLDAAVTVGPSNTSACLGSPASFSVTAVGSGLSYQWYHNNLSTPVGINSPTYSIPAVNLTDAGTYFVVVTGTCGPVTSGSASLAITPGPVAASNASSDTPAICTGSGPATITLTATGGSGDTFTWYADSCGGTVVGTGTSITIPAPLATTTYFGRWSTICGSSGCVSTTVTHIAPPTANAGGPYVICAGGVVQLNGSSTDAASVQWSTSGDGFYHNALIPNAVYTPGPNDLATGSVTLTFTVFPTAPCATPATSSTTVTINPLPVAPTGATTSATNFCAGSVSDITLTAIGGSGAKLAWTAGSCGGATVGIEPSITIPAPSSTTTYYARWINGCGTSSCVAVTVTVNQLPNQPILAPVSGICSGQPVTLSGSVGVGETIDWFDGGCGSGPVGSGTSIIVSPNTTTTYFARARDLATGCISPGCQSVTVNVTTTPTSPSAATVDAPAYCSGSAPSTITLTASGGTGGVYKWYSGSCGTTPVGMGSPLIIPAPTSTTTYYVRREDGACFSATCANVTVTVTNTPTSPASASVDAPTYCTGAAPSTISLTASGGVGGTYHWYSSSCGGTPVGMGSPLTISAPTSTTTYYVRREDGSCFSPACASVVVTVNASPEAPTGAFVDQASFCEGAFPTITLTAPGGSGDVLKWYSGACGATPVGVGSPLVITAPTTSTTYFARWESVLCGNSSCQSVSVHVDPSAHAPTSINVSANNYCAGSVTSLTLTAVGGSGATLEWFDTSCGGTVIGTGNPLVIPAPLTTTTYSARYVESVCGPSSCQSTVVTVNPVTGACCTGWGNQKVCNVVEPINCQGAATPTQAYRGNCTTCGTPFCCGADYNNNGHIEVQDIFDFLDAWFQQVPSSDFNHDNAKNVQDIFDFLSAWFAGC